MIGLGNKDQFLKAVQAELHEMVDALTDPQHEIDDIFLQLERRVSERRFHYLRMEESEKAYEEMVRPYRRRGLP